MSTGFVRIVAVVFAMWGSDGADAQACSCLDPGPPCQAYWTTDVIFRGRAESIGRPADRSVDPRQFVMVRFTILEPFKGVEAATVDVRTPTGPASCALRFTKGREYVVHASRVNDVVTTSACSRTRRVERAADDLAYARSVAAGGAPLGRISGRVALRRERSWSGSDYVRPMRGVPVTLRRGDDFDLMVRTDRLGRFMANGLEPGTYSIDVAPAGRFRVEAPRNITLADARGCAVADVALYPDGRVSGRVVEASGRPIRGLTVDLWGRADSEGRHADRLRAVTRHDGSYEFTGVPPGRFVVSIDASGDPAADGRRAFHPGVTDAAEATLLSVPPGGDVTLPDFVIPEGVDFVEVAGVVFDARRMPVEGARVYLRGPGEHGSIMTAPVLTDFDGRFAIAAPAGLEYLVFAEHPNRHARGRLDATELVPVTAQPTSSLLTLTLRSLR